MRVRQMGQSAIRSVHLYTVLMIYMTAKLSAGAASNDIVLHKSNSS